MSYCRYILGIHIRAGGQWGCARHMRTLSYFAQVGRYVLGEPNQDVRISNEYFDVNTNVATLGHSLVPSS